MLVFTVLIFASSYETCDQEPRLIGPLCPGLQNQFTDSLYLGKTCLLSAGKLGQDRTVTIYVRPSLEKSSENEPHCYIEDNLAQKNVDTGSLH